MDEEKKSVGEKLRFYREACALSQKQVADALNLDRTTYTKYETGASEPGLHTLVRIARIFNVSPIALLPQDEPDDLPRDDAAKPGSNIYQLKKDERRLVALYRALEGDEKRRVMDSIIELLKND